ncbi:IMPACT family protein [Noviherbaspirillum saxi]|uniref:YigZ family protein n=1 Tax=Noviherbaspirillum saxi TaxID=2320863 RepID=A0A3A3FPA6_9BURK|nr:YigZ family protein [Noviherbaspirillum saxi]RJF95282.1 YigZ family protein [Noviherbaspirillum saxi]
MTTYSLSTAVHAELDIRKSRFIAVVLPVADRAAAMRVVEQLRAEHRAATHVCWALMAGGQSGMSDDGEPSGTAGRPMLEVLRHHELDGVLAAVVRYYGGIKLGAGGLVRAYTDAVAAALKQAVRIERIVLTRLCVEVDYPDEARVRRWITQQGQQACSLIGVEHGPAVRLMIDLPAAELDAARIAVAELTQGRARLSGDESALGR